MAPYKNPAANLRGKYKRFFETSLVISLALVIAAFRFFPRYEVTKYFEVPPDIINLENIQSTRQELNIPPPPKPPVMVEISITDPPVDLILDGIDWQKNTDIKVPPDDNNGRTVTEEENNIFIAVAEEMPQPLGGINSIRERIIYPELAVKAGIEGKVYVLAFVDDKGNVVATKIIKGVDILNDAAEKAVKETKFLPGKQRRKPVKVQVTIPVVFRLK